MIIVVVAESERGERGNKYSQKKIMPSWVSEYRARWERKCNKIANFPTEILWVYSLVVRATRAIFGDPGSSPREGILE